MVHVAAAVVRKHLCQAADDHQYWPSHVCEGIAECSSCVQKEQQADQHNDPWDNFVVPAFAYWAHLILIHIFGFKF